MYFKVILIVFFLLIHHIGFSSSNPSIKPIIKIENDFYSLAEKETYVKKHIKPKDLFLNKFNSHILNFFLKNSKKIFQTTFNKKIENNPNFMHHLSNDIFGIYYNEPKDFKFEDPLNYKIFWDDYRSNHSVLLESNIYDFFFYNLYALKKKMFHFNEITLHNLYQNYVQIDLINEFEFEFGKYYFEALKEKVPLLILYLNILYYHIKKIEYYHTIHFNIQIVNIGQKPIPYVQLYKKEELTYKSKKQKFFEKLSYEYVIKEIESIYPEYNFEFIKLSPYYLYYIFMLLQMYFDIENSLNKVMDISNQWYYLLEDFKAIQKNYNQKEKIKDALNLTKEEEDYILKNFKNWLEKQRDVIKVYDTHYKSYLENYDNEDLNNFLLRNIRYIPWIFDLKDEKVKKQLMLQIFSITINNHFHLNQLLLIINNFVLLSKKMQSLNVPGIPNL